MRPDIMDNLHAFPSSYDKGNWLQFQAWQLSEGNALESENTFWNSIGEFISATTAGRMFQDIEPIGAVSLYLPEHILQGYATNWEGTELGSLASIAESLTGDNPFSDLVGGSHSVLKRKLAGWMGGVAGINVEGIYDFATKTSVNNHLNLLFSGVPLRNFSFEFKLYPNNTSEAIAIENIVRFFKVNMYPSMSGGNWTFRYPNTFRIIYMRDESENTKVGRIGECALKSCDVQYGEGEYVPIKGKDGTFFSSLVTLKLSFEELTFLHKGLVENEGY